jgi:hypothetical protein
MSAKTDTIQYDKSAKIVAGQDTSDVVDLEDTLLAGIFVPTGFQGTRVDVLIGQSNNVDSLQQLVDEEGDPVGFDIGNDGVAITPDSLSKFAMVRFFALQSDSTENADRVIDIARIKR